MMLVCMKCVWGGEGGEEPHLLDPRLLIDFLINSYDAGVYEVCVGRGRRKGLILRMYFPSVNAGGVISLLALNGLFILMHEYHL